MRSRFGLGAAVLLAGASVACVGDDTVSGEGPGVQGGSGPPPSSYDATVDGQGGAPDAAADVTGAEAGDARATLDARLEDGGIDAPGADASDAGAPDGPLDASEAGSADAGDAADGD